MMGAQELKTLWRTLAHKILASILVDHGAVFPVMDVLGHDSHWFPEPDAQVWRAVLQCVVEDVPPTVEAVTLRCVQHNGYIQALANQWNEADNRVVVYHAQELKRVGALAELRRLGRELQELIDPADVEGGIQFADARLSGILAATTRRQGNAQSVSDSAWEKIEKFQGHGVPTGLEWFDQITGGLWTGMNYWLVAAYKMGKSMLMRNMILRALESGHAVDVYCAEGSRELFALDCQAMIATRLLCERGERRLQNLRLSGLFIMRVWRNGRAVLTKDEWKVINEAKDIWKTYNIRVWDTTDGIRNLAALRHRVKKSKMEYGSLIHWCDYSQLFGLGNTLYERQSKTALMVQEIAAGDDVTLCMLAQRNEQAIAGGGGYSIGVKGGGEASAAADFLLMPSIDQEVPNTLNVTLKFSRHTGRGSGSHLVNLSSGLILDRWWDHKPAPLNFEVST